jgi:CBS domain containing-hemolysin-like protein
MYMLRKLPRPTDSVIHGGFKFEVIDVDHHRIDQLLSPAGTAGTVNRCRAG